MADFIPQLIALLIIASEFGVRVATGGRAPYETNWVSFIASTSIWMALLWWGGFFDGMF